MKLLVAALIGLSAAQVFTQNVNAQGFPDDVFSVPGVTNTTTLVNAIVPAAPNGGQPRIQLLSAASDKAASVITFLTCTNGGATLTNSTAVAGNFWSCSATSKVSANDWVVINYKAQNLHAAFLVSNVTAQGFYTYSNTVWAASSGDGFYKMSTNGQYRFGATTNTLTHTSGLYNGPRTGPILLLLDRTTLGSIDVVSGDYFKR